MKHSTKQIFQFFSVIFFAVTVLGQDYGFSSKCFASGDEAACPARINSRRGGAAEQLSEHRICSRPAVFTTSFGRPVDSITATLTAGPRGPVLFQDFIFEDDVTHAVRERIPERIVHAKGAGAFGRFKVTHDITRYTKADIFAKVGKETPMAVRFSTVLGERGSPDISPVREHRGFAMKFYTDEGIFDLIGNSLPVFFIRDTIHFTSLIHSGKRNPVTNLVDADSAWDFFTLRPESTHELIILASDLGIPASYRYINGHAINTFKLENAAGRTVWCKFHWLSNQGIRNLSPKNATKLRGTKPDLYTEDLYNAIHRGDFPSWTFYIQVMTPEQVKSYRWNPFDATKIWPEKDFPYLPVGEFVLDTNPRNFFKDVEQIAFAPSHLVPGVDPSPDKVLQGRFLAYIDAHHHRLGANNVQLPVNCPFARAGLGVHNIQRDGKGTYYNQGGSPNYYPNSFGGPHVVRSARISPFRIDGVVDRYESLDEDNFSQPAMFYNSLSPAEQSRVVKNLATDFILNRAQPFIQRRAVEMFSRVNVTLGQRLAQALRKATYE